MEFYRTSLRSFQPDSPREIEERLRRRYLDRLGIRIKKLRKLLIERNWEELRSECSQLATSGENFGFKDLTQLASVAEGTIPLGRIPRAATPLQAKETIETLISEIDSVLIEHSVPRA